MSRKEDETWRPNFGGQAVALVGRLTKVADTPTDHAFYVPNGSAALGPTGGHSLSESTGGVTNVSAGSHRHTVVSFLSAHAKVTGTYTQRPQDLTVTAESVLRELTVKTEKHRMFVPTITGSMKSSGDGTTAGRTIEVLEGTLAEGIEFGSSLIKVTLRRYSPLSIQDLIDWGNKHGLHYRKTEAVALTLVKEISIVDKGELKGHEPRLTPAGRPYGVYIPGFGSLFFGEVTVQPAKDSTGMVGASVQLTTLRMELGCSFEGSGSAGYVRMNEPQGHPPR